MPGRMGPAGRGGARRRTRRRTAAVVGGTAYVAGKNKGDNSAQQADENAVAEVQPAAQSVDPMEELQKLGDLHGQGILTDEEFETKKAELLKQI